MCKIQELLTFQNIKDFLLIAIPLITVFFTFRYRRKDIYTQLLKEQVTAAYSVMNDVLEFNYLLSQKYQEIVGHSLSNSKDFDEETIINSQAFFSIQIGKDYHVFFNKVVSKSFVFPKHVQEVIMKYIERLNYLLDEEGNNSDLGINILNLYEYSADIVDKLSDYFKIEKLSKQMRRLL